MVAPRWRKVLSDLWGQKWRTVLVILSITIGVAAIGMVVSSQVILSRDLAASYAAANPANATVYVLFPFDDGLVQSVHGVSGVDKAEGRRSVMVRFKTSSGEWRNLQLFVIQNYGDVNVNLVRSETGSWPPGERELLIERAALSYVGAKENTLLIETPGGQQRHLRIAGTVYDPSQQPVFVTGAGCGYITPDTLEWLGESQGFNELYIVVSGNTRDKDYVQQVANRVQDKVERNGQTVVWVQVPEPDEHPMESIVNALLLLMGVFGFLTLLLGGSLVTNTIAALLAREVRQIGMLKAIGARSHQVIGMYLVLVLALGLFSLLFAIPLGMLGTRVLTSYIATLLNFDIVSYDLPFHVFGLEALLSLVLPILAALYPILKGTRVTAREALTDYGLNGKRLSSSLVERILQKVRWISRPLRLSLRNALRQKGRMALTLVTLSLGSAVFIALISVRSSIALTIDDSAKYFNYDIEVNFDYPYRIERIERVVQQVPGVIAAETWGEIGVRRIRADESEGDSIFLIAPPAATEMIQPVVLRGRWLVPGEGNALVINSDVLRIEPDLDVGQEVVLQVKGRKTSWRIVGVVKGLLTGPIAYADYPYFTRVVRDVGRSSTMMVVTERHDEMFESRVAKELEQRFKAGGMGISAVKTTADTRKRIQFQFDAIITVLLVMIFLVVAVGGLGLIGAMMLNVLERTREIGVMRAIGASHRIIVSIVVTEGIFVGLISWIVGAVLSLPLSRYLSDTAGIMLTQSPFHYAFSMNGTLVWLIVVVVLASAASLWPALRATRISVRDALVYE